MGSVGVSSFKSEACLSLGSPEKEPASPAMAAHLYHEGGATSLAGVVGGVGMANVEDLHQCTRGA